MEEVKEVKEEIKGDKVDAKTDAGSIVDRDGKRLPNQRAKRRVCGYCANKITFIDYKDVVRLKKYMTEKGKIVARRQTGVCAKHQRELTNAIKRARNMSLI